MDEDSLNQEITATEQKVTELTKHLEQAKGVVQQWTGANASLSLSAAAARAENQSSGRGLLGAFLGSKFRSTMRRAAASSNAAIAKDVAEKRAKIAEGKREAQNLVKQLQSELTDAKQELKALMSGRKAAVKVKTETTKTAKESLSLLQKLKEAYDAGILTEQEYEEKPQKLVSSI